MPAPGIVAGIAVTAPISGDVLSGARDREPGELGGRAARVLRTQPLGDAHHRRPAALDDRRDRALGRACHPRGELVDRQIGGEPHPPIVWAGRRYPDDPDATMTDHALTPRERRLRRGLVGLAMACAVLALLVIAVLVYWRLYLLGPSGDPFTRGPFVIRLSTTEATLAWSIEGGRRVELTATGPGGTVTGDAAAA